MSSAEQIADRIRQIYAHGSVQGEDGTIEIFSGPYQSVTEDRGRFLGEIRRSVHPQTTLEIGMAWGLSTLFIIESALRQGTTFTQHVVMDPFQSSAFRNAGLQTVRDAGALDLVEFYEESSTTVMPRLVTEGRQFDLIFLDGSHRFDDTFVEFYFVHRLLRPGGVVVFDDSWSEPVKLVCQFAESNYDYQFVAGYRGPHRPQKSWLKRRKALARPLISAFQKPTHSADRAWDYLVPFYASRWERRIKRASS